MLDLSNNLILLEIPNNRRYCFQASLNHHRHLIHIVGHMSDASDASDAVSAPSTVFSRVAASAAWKRLNRLMPALAAAVILLMGFVLIAVTPALSLIHI